MPSHQQNLDAVREACVRANPEIAELKWGCEVKHLTGEGLSGTLVGCDDTGQILYVSYARHYPNKTSILHWSREACEVVGREITIGDVLLALGENYAVRGDGSLWELEKYDDVPDTFLCEIDLRTGLSGWSEEAVAALANLLKRDE